MAMVKKNRFSEYRSDAKPIVKSLNNGLQSFSTFVHKSSNVSDVTDEIEFIEHVLKPKVDKAKDHFDRTKKCGKDLLTKVNEEFEEITEDVEQKKREIRNMDLKIASLTEELKGKEKEVTEAQKQCDKKRANLRQAESALSEATRKLDDAETAQVATEAAGYTTAGVCLVASIVFPPALIGVAAGAATGVVGSTVLRDAKKDCENIVNSARREVSSSENELKNAKENKRSTKKQLSDLSDKKQQAKNKLSVKQKVLEELKTFQRDIITLNEKIKILFRNLSTFDGHFKVLHHETRGGYSISSLRDPTMKVCGSLYTLLECHALRSLCKPLKLDQMQEQINKIQSVEWLKSIEDQDDDDVLSLI